MAKLQDFGPEILFRDLACCRPTSLAIDCVDPDRFSGVIARFIAIGLVQDTETTGDSLLGIPPVLGEDLQRLESPVGGSDGAERVLLAHGLMLRIETSGTWEIKSALLDRKIRKGA